jgi:hypothetical protein
MDGGFLTSYQSLGSMDAGFGRCLLVPSDIVLDSPCPQQLNQPIETPYPPRCHSVTKQKLLSCASAALSARE